MDNLDIYYQCAANGVTESSLQDKVHCDNHFTTPNSFWGDNDVWDSQASSGTPIQHLVSYSSGRYDTQFAFFDRQFGQSFPYAALAPDMMKDETSFNQTAIPQTSHTQLNPCYDHRESYTSSSSMSQGPAGCHRMKNRPSIAWNEPYTSRPQPSTRLSASPRIFTANGISQPDENGMYQCFWSGCTYRNRFSRDLSLWRHIKAKHLRPRSIKCSLPGCGKRFDRLDGLRAHQRATDHHSR